MKNNTIPFIYISKRDKEKIKQGFKLLHKILEKGGARDLAKISRQTVTNDNSASF